MAPLSPGRTPWTPPTHRSRRRDSLGHRPCLRWSRRDTRLTMTWRTVGLMSSGMATRSTLGLPRSFSMVRAFNVDPPSLRAAVFRRPSPARSKASSQEVEEHPLFLGEVALLGDDHLFYALAIVGDHRPLCVVLDDARAYLGRAGYVAGVAQPPGHLVYRLEHVLLVRFTSSVAPSSASLRRRRASRPTS